jgi:pyridinium-3,5-bisthiocarboxylic acid mononucleotide nickel chelatase
MIGWIDAASGASGDMLLAAVIAAGASEQTVLEAIDAVVPEPVSVRTEPVRRGGLAAIRACVDVPDSAADRRLSDVRGLISAAPLDDAVGEHASAVFGLLATAEADVHGTTVDEVHFHEVGALDALADIVGVCAGLTELQLDELHCGPVAVGSGRVSATHGSLSVPAPAVVKLLGGVRTYAGLSPVEMCTPTGAALLRHWVTCWGPQPLMRVQRVGVGAGSRDLPQQPNVLRIFVGPGDPEGSTTATVLEANVDDLDPRVWPSVLEALLSAGASDAWLTPILMKKGRPAYTLSVLCRPDSAHEVREAVFAHTSSIGLRELSVGKRALERDITAVHVEGQRVRVKVARADGRVVNVQPEYDDVAAAATALGRPVKAVLAQAAAACSPLWAESSPSGGQAPPS